MKIDMSAGCMEIMYLIDLDRELLTSSGVSCNVALILPRSLKFLPTQSFFALKTYPFFQKRMILLSQRVMGSTFGSRKILNLKVLRGQTNSSPANEGGR